MKKYYVLICLTALIVTGLSAQEAKKKIFNGKNLKGWEVPADNLWWSVENGVLMAKSDPSKTGSILWTKKQYQDFVMSIDFKMGDGVVDSGVFVREEKLQIQIGISGSLKRDMTASPYVPGKGYPVEARNVAQLLKVNDWNSMKIVAKGPLTTVWLNGEQVMEYTAAGALEEGPIGLQMHPNRDMDIAFRDVRVSKLK